MSAQEFIDHYDHLLHWQGELSEDACLTLYDRIYDEMEKLFDFDTQMEIEMALGL